MILIGQYQDLRWREQSRTLELLKFTCTGPHTEEKLDMESKVRRIEIIEVNGKEKS